LILLAACGSKPAASVQASATDGSDAHPIEVTTAAALARQVAVYIPATGSFVPRETSDIAPFTSGRVTETPVNAGAFVHKGDVLARLDDRDARLKLDQMQASADQMEASVRQAQAKIGLNQGAAFDATSVPEVQASRASYESAQAQAKLAEADSKRYASLVATGDVSQSNYEQKKTQADTAIAQANAARRQYEGALNAARQNYQGVELAQSSSGAARAQVAQAKKAVDDTVIRSPLSGYVTARPIAVGEYVTTSSKIATIVVADPIKLELQIPEADAARLSLGMTVSARVVAYGDRAFSGKVTALNPAVDASSRALTVEASFDNPNLTLRPGMFATARLLLPQTENAVLAPRAAVLTDANTNSSQAFAVENGRVRVRVVRIGEPEDGMVRILSGVSAGETLASSRLEQLYDGAAVRARH
jgi:RND family efflux transporter MFP subunit